jgi:hypothetical protein
MQLLQSASNSNTFFMSNNYYYLLSSVIHSVIPSACLSMSWSSVSAYAKSLDYARTTHASPPSVFCLHSTRAATTVDCVDRELLPWQRTETNRDSNPRPQ